MRSGFIVFHAFHRPAFLRSTSIAAFLTRQPVFVRSPNGFELHGAEIVQSGMRALPVIPEYPGQHRVLGLANGLKAQRSRYAFSEANRFPSPRDPSSCPCGSLTPARHGGRGRLRKSSLAYWLPRSMWKIICPFWRAALKQDHLQLGDHQAAMHVRPHRPTTTAVPSSRGCARDAGDSIHGISIGSDRKKGLALPNGYAAEPRS